MFCSDSGYENRLQFIPPGDQRSRQADINLLRQQRLLSWIEGDKVSYEWFNQQIIKKYGRRYL